MSRRVTMAVVGLVFGACMACDGSQRPRSDAGSGVGGGTAGAFGGGAVAGGGAVVDAGAPACGPSSSRLQFDVRVDGVPVNATNPKGLDAIVAVSEASVSDGGVHRLGFTHDGGAWQVEVRLPEVSVVARTGESIRVQLAVEDTREGISGTTRKRIVLSRGGEPYLFMHLDGHPPARFATAPLASIGLTLTEGTSLCSSEPTNDSFGCGREVKALGLSVDGGAPVFITPGTSAPLGAFDVTVDAFQAVFSRGNCDGFGSTFLGGVRVR
jgi:hypothetical protein